MSDLKSKKDQVSLNQENAEKIIEEHFRNVAIDIITKHRSGSTTIDEIGQYLVHLFKMGVAVGTESLNGKNDIVLDFGE